MREIQCVENLISMWQQVTMENFRGVPKDSEVRIVDVQGKQLMVQVSSRLHTDPGTKARRATTRSC